MTTIIVTAIICTTIVALALIGHDRSRKSN